MSSAPFQGHLQRCVRLQSRRTTVTLFGRTDRQMQQSTGPDRLRPGPRLLSQSEPKPTWLRRLHPDTWEPQCKKAGLAQPPGPDLCARISDRSTDGRTYRQAGTHSANEHNGSTLTIERHTKASDATSVTPRHEGHTKCARQATNIQILRALRAFGLHFLDLLFLLFHLLGEMEKGR